MFNYDEVSKTIRNNNTIVVVDDLYISNKIVCNLLDIEESKYSKNEIQSMLDFEKESFKKLYIMQHDCQLLMSIIYELLTKVDLDIFDVIYIEHLEDTEHLKSVEEHFNLRIIVGE